MENGEPTIKFAGLKECHKDKVTGVTDTIKEVLNVSKNNYDLPVSVDIDRENITSTPALKLLGITIEDKLEYSPHITAILCGIFAKHQILEN